MKEKFVEPELIRIPGTQDYGTSGGSGYGGGRSGMGMCKITFVTEYDEEEISED